MDKNCRKGNSTDICSNNGDCVCGTCECKKRENPEERYSGEFCDCDNFNCDRSNNKLCGGRGLCVCVCVTLLVKRTLQMEWLCTPRALCIDGTFRPKTVLVPKNYKLV